MTASELIQLLITYAEPNDTVSLVLNGEEIELAELTGVDRDLPTEHQVALFFENKE
jgi:hypothetical protein